MSEYLTSLVRRALAPELSVRPRLSSMFDRPARAESWEMSAYAPEEGSAEVESAAGPAARRASAAIARDQRSQSPATFDAAAVGPTGVDRAAAVPRGAAATRTARAAMGVVSKDGGSHPMPPRENGAQAEAKGSTERSAQGREKPLPTGRNESPQLPDRGNGTPRGGGVEFHAALRRPDGVSSDEAPTASHGIEVRSPFGRDASRPSSAATAPKVSFPSEQSEPDPGPTRQMEPELARRIRQTKTSPPSATAEEGGSAIGRLPVVATKPRPAESRPATSELAHSAFAAPSRRDAEQRDQRISRAPPSTIQVTIGRIEVRATTVAEPRQKPRPSSGATSLDAYLRDRSGRSGS